MILTKQFHKCGGDNNISIDWDKKNESEKMKMISMENHPKEYY